MSEIAINCRKVSKRYRLGQRESYGTLRDVIARRVASPLRRVRQRVSPASVALADGAGPARKEFYALKGVSFEVKRGEIIGIIGRNGAGKSTLLKILSRITRPTAGEIELRGRVGSLLEVGTGFHPELTGRENIFLNGAILGMKKVEIERKFEEIVGFAGVEEFIDTPVKRFSSGMYLRLAFAVAAHLEPEILIVDEVLAVGDSDFQRKCINRMQDVGQHGRTILFVSHNMTAVTRLCQRAILLDGGEVLRDGPSHAVVAEYLNSGLGRTSERTWPLLSEAPGNEIARLCAVRVRTRDGAVSDTVDIRQPVGIEMEYEVLQPGHILAPNYHFFNEEGVYVFLTGDQDPHWRRRPRPAGRFISTAWIPGNFLAEGSLSVTVILTTPEPVRPHFTEKDAVAFQVVDTMEGDSVRGDWVGPFPGVVRPRLEWTTEYLPNGREETVAARAEKQ